MNSPARTRNGNHQLEFTPAPDADAVMVSDKPRKRKGRTKKSGPTV
jgi:hypothetical protein